MKRFRSVLLVTCLAVAIALVPVRESTAGPCMYEGHDVWCEIWSPEAIFGFSTAGTAVVGAIGAMTTAMVGWIEIRILPVWPSGFGKINAEFMKQTASVRVMKEGNLTVDTQLHMQEASAVALENAVPPAHLSTTVTNGLMLGEQAPIVAAKKASGDLAFMSDYYSDKNVGAGAVIKRHEPYCANADVALGRCSAAATDTMQNADITVNTVLNPGEGQYETLADEERDAARAFVKNVINPVPVYRPAGAASAQNQAYEAALLADQAALSLAAHSFNSAIANRTRRHQQ